jgi:hypothetical protein
MVTPGLPATGETHMTVDEMSVEAVLRALFPQLDEKDIKIMASNEDVQAAIDNLKGVVSSIATQLENIATRLQAHPATNNDAILEGFVGDLNTMASQLSTAGGDETGAETGSVLDNTQPTEPAAGPTSSTPAGSDSSGPSSSDTSGLPATTGDDAQLTDAVTGEVIGAPLGEADTATGASGAGSDATQNDAEEPVDGA